MGISAVINTYNASEHLREVLEGVKEFDQIVICDMESTDNTLDIAREYGAKIVTFPKENHTFVEPARQTAIEAADHEWVFVVDADEIVSPQLRSYLYDFIGHSGDVAGLLVPRKNFLFGSFKRSEYPDYQLRFLKRDGTVWPPFVHARPQVAGRVDKIPSGNMDLALEHLSADISSIIDRSNRYTTAEVSKHPREKVTLLQFMFEPWFRFIKSYIFKGGFRMGIAGYMSAKNDAIYRHYRLSKTYEDILRKKRQRK